MYRWGTLDRLEDLLDMSSSIFSMPFRVGAIGCHVYEWWIRWLCDIESVLPIHYNTRWEVSPTSSLAYGLLGQIHIPNHHPTVPPLTHTFYLTLHLVLNLYFSIIVSKMSNNKYLMGIRWGCNWDSVEIWDLEISRHLTRVHCWDFEIWDFEIWNIYKSQSKLSPRALFHPYLAA